MNHHLHSSYEKSIIERTIQYIKDRTESFDDYFPCRKEKCKLQHIRNWFNFFVNYHNKEVMDQVSRAVIALESFKYLESFNTSFQIEVHPFSLYIIQEKSQSEHDGLLELRTLNELI
jgi:hypothetical protein